jgi:hypothetical protein
MRRYLRAVLILSFLSAPARAQTGPQLTESNVAGGGGVSTQGSLRLEGAIGQASAGTSSGGTFNLNGGFFTPQQSPSVVRANDAAASEPAAGTSQMLFTVTLDSPAPAGGLSVSYATADGTAEGGASCGGAVDYVSASGSLSFAAGERFKTVSVGVCADGAAPESSETLLLNLSGATTGTIADAQATGTITQGTAAGALVISELRTSGPGGAGDDFVELYNNTDSPLTVAASDSSGGYGLFKMGSDCNAAPVLVATVPNGTVIPARGHYLAVGSQYTLKDYGGTNAAAGDVTLASDIESDRNVAVFTTADVNAVSTAARLDAVGFGTNAGAVCGLLREGASLGAVSGTSAEHSFFRRECDFVGGVGCTTGGNPKDSNDNAADFTFADTLATTIAGVPQRLGVPGPENLASPVRRDDSGVGVLLLDGSASSSQSPNRVRSFTSDQANNSTYGTLTVRRRVVNNTGGSVTRLRFRIIEMTTFPVPTGTADLRARTSVDEVSVGPINDAGTCAAAGAGSPPCSVTVKGLTLEEPAAQPNGGGANATLAAGTVTLAQPLAAGASLPVSFLLGLQSTGTFRFYIIVEALP